MSDQQKMYLAKTGMVTPLGSDLTMTAAAFNAGYRAVEETAIFNKKLKPIKMACVPADVLPAINKKLEAAHLSSRQLRLLQLASAALVQLKDDLPADVVVPLYLVLPEVLPNIRMPLTGNFIQQLIIQSEVAVHPEKSLFAEIGRVGGLYALEAAYRYLAQEGNDYVILGGVDTYWDPEILARLDAQDRLMLEGVMDGFFPGEGACFLLLVSDRIKNNLSAPRVAIAKPGIAKEAGHRYSDQPYLGEGLAAAVTHACNEGPDTIEHIWTSMIYDSFDTKEFGVALTRNAAKISSKVKMHHPADCFGDMAAAMGTTLIGLVAAASAAHKCRHHLLCASSDLARRAAVRVDIED